MNTLTYEFASLEEIAKHIDNLAAQAGEHAKLTKLKRQQPLLLREQSTFEEVARLLRNSTLTPGKIQFDLPETPSLPPRDPVAENELRKIVAEVIEKADADREANFRNEYGILPSGKLAAIRRVRELTGWGLREAMTFVERCL